MLLAGLPRVPTAYPIEILSNSTPPGSSPTEDQEKPHGPLVWTWHAPTPCALVVSETVWPLAKHHRVLMLGSSSRTVVDPWLALKTMFGLSQHHHHHGNSARIRESASFAATNAVRALSGCSSALVREAANATPVIRSAAAGCRSGATPDAGKLTAPVDCTCSRCSRFSITARMSSSHHHGQHCHQTGQHGHQQRREHQLKVAVKLPLASVVTVTIGVSTKPLTPVVTL